MQEKLLKMTSEHRLEMASKRGRPTQLEQGRDGGVYMADSVTLIKGQLVHFFVILSLNQFEGCGRLFINVSLLFRLH